MPLYISFSPILFGLNEILNGIISVSEEFVK